MITESKMFWLFIYQYCNLSKIGLLAGVVKKKTNKDKAKHKTQNINNK